MNPKKKEAHMAGLLYLALAVTGVFSLLYVPSTLIVFGDAATPADNIRSSELLFRAGILSGLVSSVIFVFLALALYRLFKEINRRQAMLMVILVAISVAISFANTINQLGALIALSRADFLSVFDQSELDSLAYLFVRLNSWGIQIIQIFCGLSLSVRGFGVQIRLYSEGPGSLAHHCRVRLCAGYLHVPDPAAIRRCSFDAHHDFRNGRTANYFLAPDNGREDSG